MQFVILLAKPIWPNMQYTPSLGQPSISNMWYCWVSPSSCICNTKYSWLGLAYAMCDISGSAHLPWYAIHHITAQAQQIAVEYSWVSLPVSTCHILYYWVGSPTLVSNTTYNLVSPSACICNGEPYWGEICVLTLPVYHNPGQLLPKKYVIFPGLPRILITQSSQQIMWHWEKQRLWKSLHFLSPHTSHKTPTFRYFGRRLLLDSH